jgi:hypothetical protein
MEDDRCFPRHRFVSMAFLTASKPTQAWSSLSIKSLMETRRYKCSESSNSPGLKTLGEAIADLTIYTTCIDEDLDESGQAVPGIGDPLQRLNLRLKGRV